MLALDCLPRWGRKEGISLLPQRIGRRVKKEGFVRAIF
jgi:hypothetical protein